MSYDSETQISRDMKNHKKNFNHPGSEPEKSELGSCKNQKKKKRTGKLHLHKNNANHASFPHE
jgi:hypothetical protein